MQCSVSALQLKADAVRESELYFWTLEENNLILLLDVYPEITPVPGKLDLL